MADLVVKDTDPDPTASVAFVDADNNPTTADDVPVWASSDESVATVSAAADGLSATIAKTGSLGATAITVDSTNASGTDVHLTATLTVVASDEVGGEVTLAPGA